MIFIFNTLVYLIFALIMSAFAKKSYEMSDDSDGLDRYEWMFIAFFTLMCAFRWNTGVDSVAYTLRFIRGMPILEGNTEHIYNYITNFIAEHRIHFSVGLGILAFGQIFPLVKALEKYRYILVTLPFVLFGNCYFLTYMNGIRQMIVSSMFVYACNYIIDKKIWKYLLFILIGSLIHHSAYMLLPLYLLGYMGQWLDKVADKRKILMITYVVCVVLGFTPSFQSVISYAEAFSEITGYTNYTDRVTEFLSGEYNKEVHNFGLMMMSYFLLGVFVIWYGPLLKEKYEDDIPCFNLWYSLAVAYGCLYFLICNVSHIFIRPVQYLQPFQLIMVSLLLWELLKNVRLRNIAYILIVVIWMECVWNLYKNQMPNSSSTYHFSWFYDLSRFYRIK